MMVSSGCIPMWKNGRSRRYLEESYFNKCFRRKTQKKNGISINNIVTSEHDMSYLVRKFRGSEDMPQRTFQNHRSYANQQDSVSKTPNAFGCNLRLPTIHDHFDDGNHQKQVSMLYRIFCLKRNNKFWRHEWSPLLLSESCVDLSPPPQATEN